MNKKQIAIFLVIIQTILLVFNIAGYLLLLLFFPQLMPHKTALLIAILLLAVSMLFFTTLSAKFNNAIIRIGSIISTVWVVANFYFLLVSLVALIIFSVFGSNITDYGIAAIMVTIGLTVYGLINARSTKVVNVTVALPNLPEFWKGKSAILISDLHVGQILREGFLKKITALINTQRPELVFISGDFYDSVRMDLQSMANEFKKIVAPSGMYFASGNHERYIDYQACEQALKNAGIKILENEKLDTNGLQIAGVSYKSDTMPDLPQTFATIDIDKNKPSILIKHVPLQLQEAEKAGFSMVVCGHTHHGQIWPGRLITKKVFKGFDYGLKMLNSMFVYTSSGAGTWGPPMRVFTKSEIVKITFE